MAGLRSVELNDFEDIVLEISEAEEYGTIEFVQAAEIYLALAVDACDEVLNFAGSAFGTKDGRVLIISAKYTGSIPPELAYNFVKEQKQALYDALAAICAYPEGWCCCLTQEQIDNGHTGECQEAQAALTFAEETPDWLEKE